MTEMDQGVDQSQATASKPLSSAAVAAVEVLAEHGIDVVFGNPGTTEIPFIKALTSKDSPVRYGLSLHEGVAVSSAAGYALVSGKPGVAQLHAMPGAANGLSQQFNAACSGVPIVVICGQQDRRHQYLNPILQADVIDSMREASKEVWEAKTAAEIPDVLRRALAAASASPAGPVFLSIPVDLWDEPIARATRPRVARESVGLPNPAGVDSLVSRMAAAEKPVFVAGDLIGRSDCGAQLAKLAELIGAEVYWAPGSSQANFPSTSPCYRGSIFNTEASFERTFNDADLAVFFGAELQAPVLFLGVDMVPPSCHVAAVTSTPAEPLGAIWPEVVVQGDLAKGIEAIDAAARDADEETLRGFAERRERVVEEGPRLRKRLLDRSGHTESEAPLSGRGAIAAIASAVPERTMVVDESVSNSWLSLLGEFPDPNSYLSPARGGSLGHGLGTAIGACAADSDRPAAVIIGDGTLLYCVQGLWTIAHERLPIVTCVLNNGGYSILKGFFVSEHFSPELAENPDAADLSGLSIESPEIDMVEIGRSFGLDSIRVSDGVACADAVREAFASGRPWLIDISIEQPLG